MIKLKQTVMIFGQIFGENSTSCGLSYTVVMNCRSDNFGNPIGPDFSNKVFFFKLKLQKIILSKNVCLNSYSSMKKKIRKIRMITFTLKVQFSHFAKLSKASWDAYN